MLLPSSLLHFCWLTEVVEEKKELETNGIIVCHFLVRLAFLGTISGCSFHHPNEQDSRKLSLQALSLLCNALCYLSQDEKDDNDVISTFCDSIPYYLLNHNTSGSVEDSWEEPTMDSYGIILMKYIRDYEMDPFRSYVAAHLLDQLSQKKNLNPTIMYLI